MKSIRILMCFAALIVAMAAISGCAGLYGKEKSRYRSSVVEYLYPKKDVQEVASVPHLSLPLQVGIAFVPESGEAGMPRLNEKEKMDLMRRISSEFKKLPFIKDIEIIPSAYLTAGGSFTNLDQIKTMHAVDVIALISYDQVQHTDEGLLSLAYWTIVGAYIVKGEKNDTTTMMDAVVYDIASRKMLFRAPGTSRIKGKATLVNLSERLRNDSSESFRLAADDLVANLRLELDQFKLKIKEMPQEVVVQHKPGYTGAGGMDPVSALILLALGGTALWQNRNKQD
jgi:rhombotail lipoprotein